MRPKLTVILSILASLATALTLSSFNPAAAQAGAPPIPTPAVTVMPDPPQNCDPASGFLCPGKDGLPVVRDQPQPASGGLKGRRLSLAAAGRLDFYTTTAGSLYVFG